MTLDFYAEIDPAEAKVHHNARAMEMKLQKKDLKEEFWPRLLKENKKYHFLKTDFDKVCTIHEAVGTSLMRLSVGRRRRARRRTR